MTKRYALPSDVQLLFIKSNKILLLKRQNTGYQDGNYGLVAGHVEAGESIRAAMVREANEEAGLKIQEANLQFNQVMHRKSSADYLTVFFTLADYQGPEPSNCEPEKCSELAWFDINNLPENIIPFVRLGIENYKNKVLFSEPDWQ